VSAVDAADFLSFRAASQMLFLGYSQKIRESSDHVTLNFSFTYAQPFFVCVAFDQSLVTKMDNGLDPINEHVAVSFSHIPQCLTSSSTLGIDTLDAQAFMLSSNHSITTNSSYDSSLFSSSSSCYDNGDELFSLTFAGPGGVVLPSPTPLERGMADDQGELEGDVEGVELSEELGRLWAPVEDAFRITPMDEGGEIQMQHQVRTHPSRLAPPPHHSHHHSHSHSHSHHSQQDGQFQQQHQQQHAFQSQSQQGVSSPTPSESTPLQYTVRKTFFFLPVEFFFYSQNLNEENLFFKKKMG
jgi:hypothetical protein